MMEMGSMPREVRVTANNDAPVTVDRPNLDGRKVKKTDAGSLLGRNEKIHLSIFLSLLGALVVTAVVLNIVGLVTANPVLLLAGKILAVASLVFVAGYSIYYLVRNCC